MVYHGFLELLLPHYSWGLPTKLLPISLVPHTSLKTWPAVVTLNYSMPFSHCTLLGKLTRHADSRLVFYIAVQFTEAENRSVGVEGNILPRKYTLKCLGIKGNNERNLLSNLGKRVVVYIC